jgi:hypothetical protein
MRKPNKSLRITVVGPYIRTQYLLNTSVDRHHYANLLNTFGLLSCKICLLHVWSLVNTPSRIRPLCFWDMYKWNTYFYFAGERWGRSCHDADLISEANRLREPDQPQREQRECVKWKCSGYRLLFRKEGGEVEKPPLTFWRPWLSPLLQEVLHRWVIKSSWAGM